MPLRTGKTGSGLVVSALPGFVWFSFLPFRKNFSVTGLFPIGRPVGQGLRGHGQRGISRNACLAVMVAQTGRFCRKDRIFSASVDDGHQRFSGSISSQIINRLWHMIGSFRCPIGLSRNQSVQNDHIQSGVLIGELQDLAI